MTKQPPWTRKGYMVLESIAAERDGAGRWWLVATFAGSETVRFRPDDLLDPKNAAGADWSSVQPGEGWPFDFTVQLPDGPIEIPSQRIRLVTDDAYLQAFQQREAEIMARTSKHPGILLRLVRLRQGVSAKELADRAGIDPRSLSQIELGRRNVGATTLQKLLKALGCTWRALDEVMDDEPPAKRGPGRPAKEALTRSA